MSDTQNRLAEALSPYLLQHADNPVHWYPWAPEALALARRLDRPILLSIGYSACHWCHVMAHESFEDQAIARRMNRHFINIKVDREERPDLDRIYQLSHQLLTGRGGGWPLTVFLDPRDHAPFFAGTYFPPRPRHGLIAFPELLERIAGAWRDQRDALDAQNRQLKAALDEIDAVKPDSRMPEAAIADVFVEQLEANFDSRHGGFGGAPKFPQGPVLGTLLAVTRQSDSPLPGRLLRDTLNAMAAAGLHDHVGGGFFRYCVDERWEIPHFEKMLYDNAQLLPVYAEAARRFDDPALARAARRLVAWLTREMSVHESGFAASLDADSADGEGAFYTWTPDEVLSTLPADQAEAVIHAFGLDAPPNFENDTWHLVSRGGESQAGTLLDRGLAGLLDVRSARPAPGRDDKVIAGWNGLMIAGLHRAGRLLDEADWRERARAGLIFVQERLFSEIPARAVWRDGRSAHMALLDDHAAILAACLEVLQSHFETRFLVLARRCADAIMQRFADPVSGALYLTPHDHETLLTRPRSAADDATPAGTAVAVRGLIRLGHLLADGDCLDAAERALHACGADLQQHPTAHAGLVRAVLEWHRPTAQVLIGGPPDEARAWQATLADRADLVSYAVPPDLPDASGSLAALAGPGPARAVLCLGTRCLPPVTNPKALREQLAAR